MRENKSEEVLYLYNSNGDSPAVFKTVVDWLNQGFEEYKTSTALSFGDKKLSYNELNKLSNKIANYLIDHGVTKGDRVGISLERSTEMIACVVGILKSGAAYVPLDSSYPKDRLEIMREDARLSLLITHKIFSDRFETNPDRVVSWEDISEEIDQYSDVLPPLQIDGEDVAYVIFTSGSTGRPKGIEMPHRALSNLIEWQLERDYFKNEARVLQYSSISFDVSFQEIASTFASGGTLFLISDEDRRDPRILLQVLDDLKIERLFTPFVALRSMIEVAITTGRLPGSLSEVITAGEQLRVDTGMREFFSKLPDSILENQYGPSETHVISAHLLNHDPSEWPDLPPIGKPIKNTDIYILDEDMNPVEAGETGELYLAGRNLAHGYLGRSELTEKSFIENSLEIPNRDILYKTGDLGLYNENGEIEFLGRADHQIKIRGYRVEPGEINTVGAKFPGIAQCLTHAVIDQRGKPQLITYYVSKENGDVNSDDFKAYLAELLPEYMVPAFVMRLESIPYTPSGKVDVKSLPKPEKQLLDSGEKVTYQSETEAELAAIWSKVLRFNNIPRTANFFDLGGDSLNAVTLFMEIEERFGKYLPLSVLTHAPTIEELSKVIGGENKDFEVGRFRSLQLIQRGSIEKVPLFLVHGGAGNVLMFKELAKNLPSDQPIYAFQWSGWDGYKGHDDISVMAKFYKEELREARPNGPYRLGGYCIGGIIAIEVANLLRAEGAEVVDPILVVDSPNLYSKYYHPNEPESSDIEREAFDKVRERLESELPYKLNIEQPKKVRVARKGNDYSIRRFPLLAKYLPFYIQLGKRYIKLEKGVKSIVQKIRIWLTDTFSVKLPVQNRERYCQISQIAAVKKYKKTIYDGDILYLKSEALRGQTLSLPGWWDDLYFGFGEVCNGCFEAYVVGGSHNDVLDNSLSHKIINSEMLKIDDK